MLKIIDNQSPSVDELELISDENQLTWIVEENEKFWLVPKPGFSPKFDNEKKVWKNVAKVSFNFPICPQSNLPDKKWAFLKQEMEASCKFLVQQEHIVKYEYLENYISTICGFVYFLNERLQSSNTKKLILSFAQITSEDVLDYIDFLSQDESLVEYLIDLVISEQDKYLSSGTLNIDLLRKEQKISDSLFKKIKTQLIHKVKSELGQLSKREALREYPNALRGKLDREPQDIGKISETKLSSIKTHLNYLFVSNVVLNEPFHVDVRADLNFTDSLDVLNKRSTSLIPLQTYNYIFNKVTWFHKEIAPCLFKYVQQYVSEFQNLTSHIAESTMNKNGKKYYDLCFKKVPMPEQLRALNISQFQETQTNLRKNKDNSYYRENLSILDISRLYGIATFLLIILYTGIRDSATRNLSRDCLRVSIVDELWDICFKKLKDKNSNEWFDELKPIPEFVYSAIEDFAFYVDEIETYFGLAINEEYLFPKFLTPSSKDEEPISYDVFIKWLDIFSDWIEVPVTGEAKRWYLRPHQLRRTFAVLFFNSFNKRLVESLSWMMGHDDLDTTLGYAQSDNDQEWQLEAKLFLQQMATSNDQYLVEMSEELALFVENIRKKESSVEIKLISEEFEQHIQSFLSGRKLSWEVVNNEKLFMYVEGVEE